MATLAQATNLAHPTAMATLAQATNLAHPTAMVTLVLAVNRTAHPLDLKTEAMWSPLSPLSTQLATVLLLEREIHPALMVLSSPRRLSPFHKMPGPILVLVLVLALLVQQLFQAALRMEESSPLFQPPYTAASQLTMETQLAQSKPSSPGPPCLRDLILFQMEARQTEVHQMVVHQMVVLEFLAQAMLMLR
jgi:hypothetical protein